MAQQTKVGQLFPKRPQFHGFMKPNRFEGEIENLEVEGAIPDNMDGTFFRVMPDPRVVPFIENDPVGICFETTSLPNDCSGLMVTGM